MAGEFFLFNFMLAYMASLLLARSSFRVVSTILTRHEFVKLGALLAFWLIVFALMGYWRGGYGKSLDIFYTILMWPVSTLTAMDDWVFAALSSDRTFGLNTLGWVVDFLSRVHLIDVSVASASCNASPIILQIPITARCLFRALSYLI